MLVLSAPEDLELLVAFANQAATAIQNARLYTQTDRALARRVDELAIFQRIDQQLNKSLDLNEVLSSALHWAMVLTSADSGSIGLLEKSDDEQDAQDVLRLLVSQGVQNLAKANEVITQAHPVLSQVLLEGSAVLTHDVSMAQSIDGTSAAAQVAVPIQLDGNVRGVITLESQKAHFLGDDDLAFLERLADRAAVAIENARLYEEIQAAHQAKSDFVSMVTHEMRLPMTAIKGYADLMMGEMVGPLNEQQRDFLQVIQRNLNRMSTLIRDLAEINRLESGSIQFELGAFALDEVVDEVVTTFREAVNGRLQTLAVDLPDTLPSLYADPRRVTQILANLVSNAHKYTPEGGKIFIQVTYDDLFARVAVQDTGVGISEVDQAKLFSQFFRSDTRFVRQQSGWGLGLYIVKRMVEAQKGDIDFVSKEGQGTTFAFTVPLAVR
ncbi:MAG: HAMP domain-containing sensor histidine kinase [Chloroflexota bacterium]